MVVGNSGCVGSVSVTGICAYIRPNRLDIPSRKKSGVVNIMVRGRTRAIRNNGIMHLEIQIPQKQVPDVAN